MAEIKTLSYIPQGVCSRQIDVEVEAGKVVRVLFTKGCHGNTQGISRLVAGMSIESVISKLEGIDCKGRGTSCPDQLSKALCELL
ncbi:MAG: TIGR03905 family TSCPD domain-containing protein [Rikenellaceae bacterium]